MNPRYSEIATRAGRRCEYCHAPEIIFNFQFEVEHITPILYDGSDSEDNLALACRSCNLRKGGFLTGKDPESGKTVRLFHPRKHRWHAHFQVNAETGEIIGITPTGRATIMRLEMNSPAQLAARRQWMLLALFP